MSYLDSINFKDLYITKKCDENLISKLEEFIDDETFNDVELIARLMGLLNNEQINGNIAFLRYVANRLGMSEELFEDFTGKKLKDDYGKNDE
jgi:hypothetical protein